MALTHLSWTEPLPEPFRDGAVTVGNFDGVHRGHQAILAELRGQARRLGGPSVVVTFDPHPLQVLRPRDFQPLLTTLADRAELLQRHGADHVVALPTSDGLLTLSPREFFDQVLVQRLRARAVVEGFNFCFGRDREGTVETLQGLCDASQIALTLVPAQALDGQPISSSRVRGKLEAGQVARAGQLLGRPYQVAGIVGRGQRRGQTLGFPTANLENIATLIPGDGVYAARVVYQARAYPGAANVGPNPTFGESARKVEVHLLDFQGDLYGQTLRLDFLERLRDVRSFSGAAELVNQLHHDVAQARTIFNSPSRAELATDNGRLTTDD